MHRAAGTLTIVLALIAVASALIAFGPTTTTSGAGNPHGDIDCDGDIDSIDALRILQRSAGIGTLPEPCKPEPVSTPTPITPPATATPVTPTATATPILGSSRANPVPLNMAYLVPEGWELTVLGFTPDATDLVLAEDPQNTPPDPGTRFALVRIRISNISAGNPAHHQGGYAPRLVGTKELAYTQFYASCGVVPDDIRRQPTEVFLGGTLEGNACFQVADDEVGFVMFTDYPVSDVSNWRWFALAE